MIATIIAIISNETEKFEANGSNGCELDLCNSIFRYINIEEFIQKNPNLLAKPWPILIDFDGFGPNFDTARMIWL